MTTISHFIILQWASHPVATQSIRRTLSVCVGAHFRSHFIEYYYLGILISQWWHRLQNQHTSTCMQALIHQWHLPFKFYALCQVNVCARFNVHHWMFIPMCYHLPDWNSWPMGSSYRSPSSSRIPLEKSPSLKTEQQGLIFLFIHSSPEIWIYGNPSCPMIIWITVTSVVTWWLDL